MRTSFLLSILLSVSPLHAAGRYFEVTYPPSDKPGELVFGVTYKVWLPDGVAKLRGVIVHQHGCGSGACKGGLTASEDLHWQALAKKWDCALLGPSYHQADGQNCRLWCDPRNGSEKTFLRSLGDLAKMSKHPELETVPWCLWGHSGGGFWASLMQPLHPDRIVAIWFRSGTAFSAWEGEQIPKPTIPEAAYSIPMILNPGIKEKGDKRFSGAWTGALAMFKAYRAKDALIAFAPDPRSAHDCGDSRYLAIPFFDVCLAERLPKEGSKLQPMNRKTAWLSPLEGDTAQSAADYKGNPTEANWLPGEKFARQWSEYVKNGSTADTTPPPAPTGVKVQVKDGKAEITWDAEADIESGLAGFTVQRDGKDLGQVPDKAVGRFGKPLFQTMSYHDTPEKGYPEMRFVDTAPVAGRTHEYRVIAINSAGLKSPAATATKR